MADNVAITAGSGTTIAADDISGVLHQRVKISIGADGSAADLAAGSAAASASLPVTQSTEDIARVGIITETAPASDTASSGLNGRLQRIAQRITSLIALLPTALGQGTMSQSLKVAIASDQSAIPVGHNSTGIGHGLKTITTAGTDEVLASSTAAKWVILQAQTDNTGVMAVGATGVDATVATGNGIVLSAGEKITLPIDNLADIFIDATVSGDGVRYTYGT